MVGDHGIHRDDILRDFREGIKIEGGVRQLRSSTMGGLLQLKLQIPCCSSLSPAYGGNGVIGGDGVREVGSGHLAPPTAAPLAPTYGGSLGSQPTLRWGGWMGGFLHMVREELRVQRGWGGMRGSDNGEQQRWLRSEGREGSCPQCQVGQVCRPTGPTGHTGPTSPQLPQVPQLATKSLPTKSVATKSLPTAPQLPSGPQLASGHRVVRREGDIIRVSGHRYKVGGIDYYSTKIPHLHKYDRGNREGDGEKNFNLNNISNIEHSNSLYYNDNDKFSFNRLDDIEIYNYNINLLDYFLYTERYLNEY